MTLYTEENNLIAQLHAFDARHIHHDVIHTHTAHQGRTLALHNVTSTSTAPPTEGHTADKHVPRSTWIVLAVGNLSQEPMKTVCIADGNGSNDRPSRVLRFIDPSVAHVLSRRQPLKLL